MIHNLMYYKLLQYILHYTLYIHIPRFQNSSILEKNDMYKPLLFYSSGPNKGYPEPFPVGSRHGGGNSNNHHHNQQGSVNNTPNRNERSEEDSSYYT